MHEAISEACTSMKLASRLWPSDNSVGVRCLAEWRSRRTARESEANTHQSPPRQAAVKRLWPSQAGGASLPYSSFMLCGCPRLPTLLNVLGITGKSPVKQVKLCNVNRADRLMGKSKHPVLATITSWVPNIAMVLVGTRRRQQKNESKHFNMLAADLLPQLQTYWTCILTKMADRSHICGIACKPLLPSNCISDFSIFRLQPSKNPKAGSVFHQTWVYRWKRTEGEPMSLCCLWLVINFPETSGLSSVGQLSCTRT